MVQVAVSGELDPGCVELAGEMGGGIVIDKDGSVGEHLEEEREFEGVAGAEYAVAHWAGPREPVGPSGCDGAVGVGESDAGDGEHLVAFDGGEQLLVGGVRSVVAEWRRTSSTVRLLCSKWGAMFGFRRIARDAKEEQPELVGTAADDEVDCWGLRGADTSTGSMVRVTPSMTVR